MYRVTRASTTCSVTPSVPTRVLKNTKTSLVGVFSLICCRFFFDAYTSPLSIMSQRRFTPFHRNTVFITTLGRKPDAMHTRMPLLPIFAYIRVLP